MTWTVQIRRALPGDAEAISALILELAHYFTCQPDGEGAERFLEGLGPQAIRAYIGDPGLHYLVATEARRLLGVAAMRDGRHLFHLFVAPAGHRQGIARQLWDMLSQAAIAAGNRQGFTVNSTPYAVPVYERFGFQACGPRVEKNGIAYVPMQAPPG
ncbi:GNAT family N-acetyltransferase [Pseudomonas zhanjiangensis]|uniref:GNAT family N-acetyltransferase n=1 Tax=Pseudomonas zhanjiangensis TaxID=3239015 RepID=A0ABV3YQD9_9PSED